MSIDCSNEWDIRIFEILLEGAEIFAENEAKETCRYFECLENVVYQFKYSAKPWLSKIMKLCISNLNNYFDGNIELFILQKVFSVLLNIIRSFKEEIEPFIEGTDFVEKINEISNLVRQFDH